MTYGIQERNKDNTYSKKGKQSSRFSVVKSLDSFRWELDVVFCLLDQIKPNENKLLQFLTNMFSFSILHLFSYKMNAL